MAELDLETALTASADGGAAATVDALASPALSPDSLPAQVAIRVAPDTIAGQKAALGMPVTFWDKVKDRLGAVQTAVASPFQSLGRTAARAAGASEPTAYAVGSWLLPVLFAAAVVASVVYFVRNRTRTVKA